MDLLFFFTTLITGIFIGALAAFGVLCIFIRIEDKKNEGSRKKMLEVEDVIKHHTHQH